MSLLFAAVIAVALLMGSVVLFGAPYVPSRSVDVRRAFTKLYTLGPNDLVIDIGSGDGRVLRAASKLGARAVGYELNPLLVIISTILSKGDANVTTRLANFWHTSFPENTTVVYTFGESRDIGKMAKKVRTEAERLNTTIHFISYGFEVPELMPIKTDRSFFLYRFEPSGKP